MFAIFGSTVEPASELTMNSPGLPPKEDVLKDIDAYIVRALETGGTVGMSVSVVYRNDIIFAKGYGYADRENRRTVTPDTLFHIASTTKSFTALTASLLANRGMLDLDAPLSRYLPGVALAPPLSPDQVTLRDLLSMTHGIDGDGPVTFRTAFSGEFTNDLLLQLLRLHAPLANAGKFEYSNIGYNIFGLVLDSQFQEGWKEVIRREVFQPLGMKGTTANVSEAPAELLALPYELGLDGQFQRVPYAKKDSNMHAAGGHVSSANDLARYLVAHLNGGRIDGRQALPEQAVHATHLQQTVQDRVFGPYHRTGWALGWDIADYDGELMLHRFGGFAGFRPHVSFMPHHNIGVVVLVNGGDAASFLSDIVATYIYERILQRPDVNARFDQRLAEYTKNLEAGKAALAKEKEKRAARQQPTQLPLESYTGTYESLAYGRMIWKLTSGQLHVSLGVASSAAEVYDASKNMFRVELTGSGDVVTFAVPQGANAPRRLLYNGYTFLRVDAN
jgi:CubicO group peptidase (beta-lactamase class C family)